MSLRTLLTYWNDGAEPVWQNHVSPELTIPRIGEHVSFTEHGKFIVSAIEHIPSDNGVPCHVINIHLTEIKE